MKAILLVGSPKEKNKSASWIIGDFLLKALTLNGAETKTSKLASFLDSKTGAKELIDAINLSDIIIFSSPLYADTPPTVVIQAMDIIKENKKNITSDKKIFVISNGSFPEASQNSTAIRIYRQFAKGMDFCWLGGFAIGMGPMLCRWRSLEIFGLLHAIKKAVLITAIAFIHNNYVPRAAEQLMAKTIIPKKIYLLLMRTKFACIAK
ncbi:MAG: NAD(P)H-dependent oxidoreductase [Candidatus Omnitrophota bacterium]